MLGIQDGGKKDKKQENSRLQIQQVQTADSRGLLRDCEIFVILRISYTFQALINKSPALTREHKMLHM